MLRLVSKRASALAIVILSVATLTASGNAQVSTADPGDLHERLEQALADIAQIQDEADTVEKQISSIDEQAAAVQRALEASSELVSETQAEIGAIEQAIARKERAYNLVRQRVEDMAVSLYKSGSTAELEMLLSADSLGELDSMLEYSSAATEVRTEILVKSRRLQVELDADRADLEMMLAQALEAKREQERQAQRLRELREAQTAKLADLREQIEASREEADAIEARSAEIAQQLASNAPASPLPAGASGFAWPISGTITSGYGERWGRMHQGIDIDCVTGGPIRASKAGTVVTAAYDDGYGYHVVIDHGGGFASLYAHNSELNVSSGESVSQGQVIAACGSTGQSTGDHVHFEIRVNGSPRDPLGYLP